MQSLQPQANKSRESQISSSSSSQFKIDCKRSYKPWALNTRESKQMGRFRDTTT